MDLSTESTPSTASAPTTEETGAAVSIIPTADRNRWLTAAEVQDYLQLSPAEYVSLIRDGSIPHNGSGIGSRLHDRAALRELLVDRVGEAEAKRAWSRLESRWTAEDEAYAASGPGAVEALQRKAAGAPALTGYIRRADPLEGRQKPAASPESAPAPRGESRPYLTAAENLQLLHEQQAADLQRQLAERKAAAGNRAQLLSTAGLRRSKMTAVEKARFLDQHGMNAYFKLPE